MSRVHREQKVLAVDPTLLARPRLAADVILHAPTEDAAAPWIVQKGPRTYIRIGADFAGLIQVLDGSLDHDGLSRALGPAWSPAVVTDAVSQLAQRGLLEDGVERAGPPGRVTFKGPHRIQLTLLHPERLLTALRPVIAVLTSRAARTAGVAIASLGLVALAFLVGDLRRAMGSPLPIGSYAAIGIAFFLTTCVHELAHGGLLSSYGGRPSRMGVMLFYFTPAFFCDVTDGWRLAHSRQRVQVALVGIAVQSVVGGAAALVAVVVRGQVLQDTLLVFAVSTYVACAVNLLPFVKLDGYLALMSHLDIPHLREKAILAARRWIGTVLFGAEPEHPLPGLRWAVPFGLGCIAMPVYIVGTVLLLLFDLLTALGIAGTVVVLLVAGGVVAYALRGFLRIAREARVGGAPMWRLSIVSIATLGLLVAAGGLVTVPDSVNGGYVVSGGSTYFVLTSEAREVPIRAEVELLRSGLLTSSIVGRAAVASGDVSYVPAPTDAFLPISLSGVELEVPAYRLTVQQQPPDRAGSARLVRGSLPVWSWLAATYLRPLGNG